VDLAATVATEDLAATVATEDLAAAVDLAEEVILRNHYF
jgi:hypothetical protein